jgi:two-component system, cell cycle sensor histidine kinase and response regulator CckA
MFSPISKVAVCAAGSTIPARPEGVDAERQVRCIRSAKLPPTRQLLAFSRKQLIEPIVLDLNASVWEAHKLLRRLIPANIEVIPALDPDFGKVKADPAQVQQILINLVVNARDAMPQGGKISIETAAVVLHEEFSSRYFDVKPGDYIMISVGDDGEGIDPEILPPIFEPFFTTKKVGQGTGLGL